MTSQDFWARKLAKQHQETMQQLQSQPVVPLQTDQPWWRVIPEQPTQQQQPQTVQPQEGEYNPRKVMHKKNSGLCPDCGGDNFFRVTSNSAQRCFECGYVEGRSIADPNRPIGMTSDGGPSQKARQTQAGGARVNNYHGNINTASEAVSYIGGI